MIVVRCLIFLAGVAIVMQTIFSAVYTFVLPRAEADVIVQLVFRTMRRIFDLRLHWVKTYAQRDRIMALYAPLALMTLLPVWLILILVGYMGMFWAAGFGSVPNSFVMSGSSLLTLGYASSASLFHTILSFSEATIGLILVAVLVAYLPLMYAAFSRRETAVTQLAARAGTPPSAAEMIQRVHRIGGIDSLASFWINWEALFAEMEESHTSLAALVFFRSPQPDHSWLTAAGAVLDTAAILSSTVDIPREPQAELCIRAGYLALRRVADFFNIEHNTSPRFPADPISIAREEFDAMCNLLSAQGIPLRPDRERAWRDFAGWRVNYDRVLLALCALVMAPYAPWSSDRSPARYGK